MEKNRGKKCTQQICKHIHGTNEHEYQYQLIWDFYVMSYINRFSALHVCVPDTENSIGLFFRGSF